jgi:hypothetical protein
MKEYECGDKSAQGGNWSSNAGGVAGPGYGISQDPWAHRSRGMRCATCMWFVKKGNTDTGAVRQMGRCRRHAPTMMGYPVVFDTDWCGDHKMDENKA